MACISSAGDPPLNNVYNWGECYKIPSQYYFERWNSGSLLTIKVEPFCDEFSNKLDFTKKKEEKMEKQENKKDYSELVPTRVIFNDPTTVVYFNDGSKVTVTAYGGDTFSKENGVAMAIMRKVFPTRADFLKVVESGYVQPKLSRKKRKMAMQEVKQLEEQSAKELSDFKGEDEEGLD